MIEIGVGIVFAVLILTWPRRSLGRPAEAGRFVADDGAPGPYHAPGLARRERLDAGLAWLGERLSLDVVMLAGATYFVAVELVIKPGIRQGWWPVLRDYFIQLMRGGY